MGTVVGKDELERLLRETAAASPGMINPRAGDGACLYRSDAGAMCLIASVLVHKLGFEYDPNWEGHEPLDLLQDLGFDKEAALAAYKWQDDPAKPAFQWGTLLK
jgi:hypothetical protein